MQYRVEELARAAGVRVDTVRFYQARGLLQPPARSGRIALYSGEHLERLQQIRELNRQGLRLEAVGRLLSDSAGAPAASADADRGADEGADAPRAAGSRSRSRGPGLRHSLLGALEQRAAAGERSYGRAELEASEGAPAFVIDALAELGLLAAGADGRYAESERTTLASAQALLAAGLPFAEMLALGRDHAAHVEQLVASGVALFERALEDARSAATPRAEDARSTVVPDHTGAQGAAVPGSGDAGSAELADALSRLIPSVARLIAVHFERRLVAAARTRLRARAAQSSAVASAAGAPDSAVRRTAPSPRRGAEAEL